MVERPGIRYNEAINDPLPKKEESAREEGAKKKSDWCTK